MPTENPRRRSLFAVWRWVPSWAWSVIVALMLTGYFLSHAPVAFVLLKAGVYRDSRVQQVYRISYAPLYAFYELWPSSRDAFIWEWKTLADNFGDPR